MSKMTSDLKLRLLLIDDEPDILTPLKKGLEHYGFEVDAFTDPKEALNHFKPDYYSLVLTDIRMPGMNGFELFRAIRKIDSRTKFAFMTAFEIHQDEFNKVFKNTQVKLFLKKPFRASELVAKINEELQVK